MALIEFSLILLLTITFFNVILTGSEFSTYYADTTYAVPIGIDALTGALAIIIVLISLAVLIGIQILASGISEQSVRAILIIVAYASIWGFFSVLSANLIMSIQVFGAIIYLTLTIIYTIGVAEKLSD